MSAFEFEGHEALIAAAARAGRSALPTICTGACSRALPRGGGARRMSGRRRFFIACRSPRRSRSSRRSSTACSSPPARTRRRHAARHAVHNARAGPVRGRHGATGHSGATGCRARPARTARPGERRDRSERPDRRERRDRREWRDRCEGLDWRSASRAATARRPGARRPDAAPATRPPGPHVLHGSAKTQAGAAVSTRSMNAARRPGRRTPGGLRDPDGPARPRGRQPQGRGPGPARSRRDEQGDRDRHAARRLRAERPVPGLAEGLRQRVPRSSTFRSARPKSRSPGSAGSVSSSPSSSRPRISSRRSRSRPADRSAPAPDRGLRAGAAERDAHWLAAGRDV